jgi:hypothetical protein
MNGVILDRLEDTTALVGDVSFTGCNTTAAVNGATAIVSLNAAVTSKVLSTTTGATEAVLIINDTTTPANNTVIEGVASGQQITFGANSTLGNIMLNAGDNFTMRVANVRVNSSLLTPNFNVTENFQIATQGIAAYTATQQTVGVVVQGFAKPALSITTANYLICSGNPVTSSGPTAASFQVTVSENTTAMFKQQAPGSTCGPNGTAACTITNGEQGSYIGNVGPGTTVPAGSNTSSSGGTAQAGLTGGDATHGTRFQFAFTGVPSGATVWVPTTITLLNSTTGSKFVVTLTASATGAFSAVSSNVPSSSKSGILLGGPVGTTCNAMNNNAGCETNGAFASLTATNGTANAYYEVTTTDNLSFEKFDVQGVVTAGSNFASTAQAGISVTVTPAPSSGSDIPTFGASSNGALTVSAFGICQTTLLWPFVAAGGGFDTGIAISNTGADPLSATTTAGGTTGGCTFSFYGTGAPSPSTGVTLPTGTFPATLAPGQTGSFSLAGSSVAPNFVGYMIAQCTFVYGHGFGYITYGQGTSSADAQGYLAEVLPLNRATVGSGPEPVQF